MNPQECADNIKGLTGGEENNFVVSKIVEIWCKYVQNKENLKKCLNEVKVSDDGELQLRSKPVTIVGILLDVPKLNEEIMKNLFQRIFQYVLES